MYSNANGISSENGVSKFRIIDLRSDTVTLPSSGMRSAMANAIVGDDVTGDDPTVNELQNRMAKLLGKEEGIFVPSGTMGNLASVMAHCWNRGVEVLIGDKSHISLFEQGSSAAIASVCARTLENKDDGTFSIEEMKSKMNTVDNQHFAPTALICLENTHNMCYGSVLPLTFIDEVCKIAHENSIKVHMDGARLFNASAESGESPERIVKHCDSVTVCLSKGLGCPAGSVIVGDREFINKVRRNRKALGGAMRQSGILAAAGLYAMDNVISRLGDDHMHAKMIAKAIAEYKNDIITVDLNKVKTNIVYLDVNTEFIKAGDFVSRLCEVTDEELKKFGDNSLIIKMSARNDFKIRFLTHIDITYNDAILAIQKIKYVIDYFQSNIKSHIN